MSDLPTTDELIKLSKRRGLDRILEAIDEAFERGEDAEIDEWLRQIEPKELSTQNIVGILTFTIIPLFRGRLASRQAWYNKARQVLLEREDVRRVDRLIGNLKDD